MIHLAGAVDWAILAAFVAAWGALAAWWVRDRLANRRLPERPLAVPAAEIADWLVHEVRPYDWRHDQ